jgi:hypothetical protein
VWIKVRKVSVVRDDSHACSLRRKDGKVDAVDVGVVLLENMRLPLARRAECRV